MQNFFAVENDGTDQAKTSYTHMISKTFVEACNAARDVPVEFDGKKFVGKGFSGMASNGNPLILLLP